jgi:glycosyltransferase involved in cell wall biosynthesis
MSETAAHHYIFVIHSLRMGGAERSLVNLANFFAARGDRVRVLVARPGGMLENELAPGVALEAITARRWVPSILTLRAKVKRDPGATLISFLFISNLRLTLLKRLCGIRNRLIITEHSSPVRYAGVGCLKGRVRRALGRFFLPAADCIFAVSPLVKRDFQQVFAVDARRIEVVPNPFDQAALERAARVGVPAAFEKAPASGYVICGVGRLVFEKGFDVLIRAVALMDADIDFRLVIVGDGPERERLENLIADLGLSGRVQLVGFDANPYRYMLRCDLLVAPSRQEGFGNVIIEAAMLGVPVIATDCIGPRYIYRDDQASALVTPESPERLAHAIATGLSAPNALPTPDFRRFLIEDIGTRYSNGAR